MRTATIKELVRLWEDPDFSGNTYIHTCQSFANFFNYFMFLGSFSGAKTFQSLLKLDRDINVSYSKIRKALLTIPNWTSGINIRKTYFFENEILNYLYFQL